jgi:hypothetical protein
VEVREKELIQKIYVDQGKENSILLEDNSHAQRSLYKTNLVKRSRYLVELKMNFEVLDISHIQLIKIKSN